MSIKLEIESRPTQEDFDDKVQQCNVLRTELTGLTEQMMCNEKRLEQMQAELNNTRQQQVEVLEKCLLDHSVQTDDIESTKDEPETMARSTVLAESPPVVVESHKTSTETPPTSSSAVSITDEVDDDALNNHPKVLYEDELIVFKEKCTNLMSENVRLQREIGELRANMGHFHNTWLHNFLLKYLVPVLFVFVAYIFYSLK